MKKWSYDSETLAMAYPHHITSYMCCNKKNHFFQGQLKPGSAAFLIEYIVRRFKKGHQFLPFFYVKSWSNLTPNGSFKICSSWRFENTPYMLILMKFWLRYLRLKTIHIFQKLISFHLFHFQLSPIFFHQIQWSGTDFFLLVMIMRIQKLSLITEIDKEITEIFKVKGKAQFPKRWWKHESNF